MSSTRRPYRYSRILPFPESLRDQDGDARLSHRLEQARQRLRKVSETLSCVTRDLQEARNHSMPPSCPENAGEFQSEIKSTPETRVRSEVNVKSVEVEDPQRPANERDAG